MNILRENEQIEFEGIVFTNCAFIDFLIDDRNPFDNTKEKKGFIVWDELKKTTVNSGHYLILTCVCGIADDAGFDLIEVKRTDNSVSWKFMDESNWNWKFKKENYDSEIEHLEKEIDNIENTLTLEPEYVIFPE